MIHQKKAKNKIDICHKKLKNRKKSNLKNKLPNLNKAKNEK